MTRPETTEALKAELNAFLESHPDIAMARPHEAHAFDSDRYAGEWTDELLDEFYGGFFSHLAILLESVSPLKLFHSYLKFFIKQVRLLLIIVVQVAHYGESLS